MISKNIKYILSLLIFSSHIDKLNGLQFNNQPSYVPIEHLEQSFLPFNQFLHNDGMNGFSSFSDLHLKEEIGKKVVLTVSSALPKFDTVGHKILSANHDFIANILHNDILSSPMKKEIILISIRLAQMGDDMGSQILQYYYNLVDASL